MQTFKKFLLLLTSHERKHAGLLLIMIIIMSLLDTIGVASILPFMTVLANPGLVESNFILNYMFQISMTFGVENDQHFLFALGVLTFSLLIISLIFKTITSYELIRFVHMREYSIGKRLIEGYLQHPYSWFLNQHSADLGKTILSEVSHLVLNGMKPLMELISRSMIVIALISLLIIADPKLALIATISLGSPFAIIFIITRKYLNKIGSERLMNNQVRFTIVSEVFGAIKDVKVRGLEQNYSKKFSKSAETFARTQASAETLAMLPRFAIEGIAFGGILLIIIFLLGEEGSFITIVPILSLFAFAGYRLMPALQLAYTALSQLAFISPSLDKLHYDLSIIKPLDKYQDQEVLSLNKTITLKNIHYNYPNSSNATLKDINITIPVKSTIGLVGTTGSGKTTIVDIILGLLRAQKGSLEIDGKVITSQNVRSWQRCIGYVPQHIYLSDDTIAANIAFGEQPENINQDMVIKAAKIANLHNYIIDELPKKYQTIVGERGVRFSGGQRQRIGIARALYHNPQVLILDEATSALDNLTEKAVMDAIKNLSKNLTIILIAHRLNTIKSCDKIYVIEKGQLKSQGTFEELIISNEKIFKSTSEK